jgi:hypothetical protein
MDTPWGPLADLNPDDRDLAYRILATDKHQLLEGLVVENTFDQLLQPLCAGSQQKLVQLDVETIIVRTPGASKEWAAFIWVRTKTEGLGRYIEALGNVAKVYFVVFRDGDFWTWPMEAGKSDGVPVALSTLVSSIGKLNKRPTHVDASIRDEERQRAAVWGYLSTFYKGRALWERVVLMRIFINHGIQPYFYGTWNLDRICLYNDQLWMLEVKHKYPFGGSTLALGINDGELEMMNLASRAGIRTAYMIIVKPVWSKDVGSMYLHAELAKRENAAVIGIMMDQGRIAAVKAGMSGSSPNHTSIDGSRELKFKSIPAKDFAFLGNFSESPLVIAGRIGKFLDGQPLPQVTDAQLRALKMD